eukprot:2481555-Amphidinium_carterae.2
MYTSSIGLQFPLHESMPQNTIRPQSHGNKQAVGSVLLCGAHAEASQTPLQVMASVLAPTEDLGPCRDALCVPQQSFSSGSSRDVRQSKAWVFSGYHNTSFNSCVPRVVRRPGRPQPAKALQTDFEQRLTAPRAPLLHQRRPTAK